MSLNITSITVNENNKVVSVKWEGTTSLGRVTGDHTMQTPEGSVAIASLTKTTVAGWVSSQLDTSGLDAIAEANGFGIPTSTTYDVLSDGGFGNPEYTSGFNQIKVEVVQRSIQTDQYSNVDKTVFSTQEIVVRDNTVLLLDQSDPTNTGHPIGFFTDANRTTPYTTGVTSVGTAGSEGAYIRLDVLYSTPSPLYYDCLNHAGMGSTITVDLS